MNEVLSKCCNARMVHGGVQCEACGSDGELEEKKQLTGYLAIVCSDEAIDKAEKFVEDWKESGTKPAQVALTFRGDKVEYTMREFLDLVGFDNLPCETCNGDGEVVTDEDDGEGHTMRGTGKPEPCPDCQ